MSATPRWDYSTAAQRARRPYQVTERGEIDYETGKLVNPNDVRGVKYLHTLDVLAVQGFLDDRHMDAADDWRRLCRAAYGSPAQRSCIDIGPVGYDSGDDTDDADLLAQREFRDLSSRLGRFQRAELIRCLWESDDNYTTRPELLRDGLSVVADYYGR